MKVHYFQHVPFEGLGSMEAWFLQQGHSLSLTRFYLNEEPPPSEGVDWLVVMGGPMSTYEEDKFPWLASEKEYIREAANQGKPVIGICLGAQLIAAAFGASVYPNQQKEIGWFPVTKTPAASTTRVFAGFPDVMEVFHWHGDTFDLPTGALRLAESEACGNQAFVLGDRVIGMQFHLETTEESGRLLVENCAADLTLGLPFVQGASSILGAPERIERINVEMKGILDRLNEIATGDGVSGKASSEP